MAISFAAQVAVVFCLLVQLEGRVECELKGCSNTSGQNKSFLRRHHVIHLPVNDTSSSYSSLNDLVCVALLVVRETAGGSLEMSLVIVWRRRQAHGEIETKTERRGREGAERKCTGVIFDLLHSSGRHCGTLHLISQTLITPDLGSQHYKTALNLREGKKNSKQAQLLHVRAEAVIPPHKHFLRELKFGSEARLIWDGERACQQKAG